MAVQSPPGIARFDSAAAMVQAIGSFLHGRDVASLSGSPLLDRAMPMVNHLPVRLSEWVYSIGGMTEAVNRARVRKLDFDRIVDWITGLLPARSYPGIFIGSSNGALVHLAAALGVPWLPQTFLCPVRDAFSDPDDPAGSLARGRTVAETIERQQPKFAVHHMHDPNQDRLMLKTMSYFRLKYRALPDAYRDFLIEHLPRGSTIYIDGCTKRWPVTRIGQRSVFQFGAVGGLEADEYFQESDRIADYLARYHVKRKRWSPPEPNDRAPEAEWGFDQALIDDIAALAEEHGWRVLVLSFEDPESLSWLAAAVYRAWYRDLGQETDRLVVDSFVLIDPHRTIRLRAIPFWLLFGVERSAAALREFLDRQPAFEEIDLMLFSHGTDGVGVVKIDEWKRLLGKARQRGCFLGVDESRYPRDFATFIRFHDALTKLGLPFELPPSLPLQRFEMLVRELGPQFGIELARNSRVTAVNSTGAV
ncbi:MAG: hypothetical protein ACJ8AH_16660 [Stellaceae bacterium]